MDLYSIMQYLTTASLIAVLMALALPFILRSSESQAQLSARERWAVFWTCLCLGILCGAVAYWIGVCLFGEDQATATVIALLRNIAEGLIWVGQVALVIAICWFVIRALSPKETVPPPTGYGAGVTEDSDARVEIKHRGSGKVLWRMVGTNFENADLSHANLRGANLRGADLSGTDLRGADLRRADFRLPGWSLISEIGVIALTGVILGPVFLYYSRRYWPGPWNDGSGWLSVLITASIFNTFRAIGKWRQARRCSICMRGADLQNADLRGATLVGARLTGAIYDEHTRWPRGFDPGRLGVLSPTQ